MLNFTLKLSDNFTTEHCLYLILETCICQLLAEIQQEQSRKDAKRLNLKVKGTKQSDDCTVYDMVAIIKNQIDVSLVATDGMQNHNVIPEIIASQV